ncbi:sensor histidine kinase [Streptomyces sp. TRM 70361]|uniref:sensor histidine kinase n=1 Tax=Streptomyces sp. TRM 70361 TaxID=3116553 RepID=UPI003FCED1AA
MSVICLAVLAAAGGAVTAAAPDDARPWVLGTAAAAGLITAVAVLVTALSVRRLRASSTTAAGELDALRQQVDRTSAQAAHLVNVSLPAVANRLRAGARAEEALAAVPAPDGVQLRQVLRVFAEEVAAGVGQRQAAQAERDEVVRQAAHLAEGVDHLVAKTLPEAFERLRAGASADTVLADLPRPAAERLGALAEFVVREYATSERRSAAARVAGAKALSRVQAAAVSMLADLREMQERHGEEMLGDLLRLDHSTSQIGLLTDRLALLMGGRASRAWNKPIVMENILRGSVGRIAAYRRVRMHCASGAAIAGFAAEGVMHLLAELVDNAANFSPPIDEVNVYVEERTAGIVVTIEDSGLRMSDAAMRRAEEAVSGRSTDLSSLQGTRLGLAVVGLLADKYDISVSYRPSSRGGTGVVVLLPPHLLAQQRVEVPASTALPASPAPPETAAVPAEPEPAAPAVAAPADAAGETAHGLPVRPRGRTMARADRVRERAAEAGAARERERPARDTGARFGAFHRARRPEPGSGTDSGTGFEQDSE